LPSNLPALQRSLALQSLLDIGICEMPPGSNRSPRIDEYLTAVGSPLGSPWCAAATAAWCRDAGVAIPPSNAGACETWLRWALEHSSFTDTPQEGCLVLYDFAGTKQADHIGVIVRLSPLKLTVEGNTSLSGFSREGLLVDLKPMDTNAVLGYIVPSAA
jgi:hypothetical protein